jgi:gamma-glutamyltranspeptidase/glutathione hydrolase
MRQMYSQYGMNQTKSTVGGLAVGVPGEMRGESSCHSRLCLISGWKALHDRHGLLPWAKLFAPAIDLARNGFPVNPDLADALKDRPFITEDPLFAEVYAPNGTILGLGDRCYRKKFAYTLETLANEGPDVFYGNSSIAANIVKAVQESGGIMTEDDLAGYETIIREPSMIEYR